MLYLFSEQRSQYQDSSSTGPWTYLRSVCISVHANLNLLQSHAYLHNHACMHNSWTDTKQHKHTHIWHIHLGVLYALTQQYIHMYITHKHGIAKVGMNATSCTLNLAPVSKCNNVHSVLLWQGVKQHYPPDSRNQNQNLVWALLINKIRIVRTGI